MTASAPAIFGYTFEGSWVPWASEAKFNVWRDHANAVGSIAGVRFGTADVTDAVDPRQVATARVSAEFFPLIGARVIEGRAFDSDDDRPGRDPVVILSYSLWQRRFGGRQGVVGQLSHWMAARSRSSGLPVQRWTRRVSA